MSHELYKKHRPARFKDVIGQPEAVGVLSKAFANGGCPHTLLFTGPSGCGKTTLARIVKDKLACGDYDFCELNAASSRGIDTVRDIENAVRLRPLSGPVRVWIIDECHQLMDQAQQAFLKLLEDTPDHVYFLLATTDPQKLLKTIRTRATEIACKPVAAVELERLVKDVAAKEDKEVTNDVVTKIVQCADGSARKALVLLGAVIDLDDEDAQLAYLKNSDDEDVPGFELVKALMPFKGPPRWADVAKVLNKLSDEEPEGLRQLLLACARKAILGDHPGRAALAYQVVQEFRDPMYGGKAACQAILAAGCWAVAAPRK